MPILKVLALYWTTNPLGSVLYAPLRQKIWVLPDNCKKSQAKENLLIYQMPTFLQNRKSSRTNCLFEHLKTNPIVASTSLSKRESLLIKSLMN